MITSKPTSLEMILKHSKNIPIFNNMGDGEICGLVNKSKTTTVEKDVCITEIDSANTKIHIVLYGSFDVIIRDEKIAELHEGDMFGLDNVIEQDSYNISRNTITARSYKNLLLSFTINSHHIEPCIVSARFYQNTAKYFANKLSVAHKQFNTNNFQIE